MAELWHLPLHHEHPACHQEATEQRKGAGSLQCHKKGNGWCQGEPAVLHTNMWWGFALA